MLTHDRAMQRTAPRFIALAITLAALAGYVDALAFSSLGGFFASFMSGNSTRFAVGVGADNMGDAFTALALILSFIAGVIVSTVVARAWPERHSVAIMLLVTGLLALAAILAPLHAGPHALLLLAAAMGAENGMFVRDGEVSIGLTYMTGSLVRMGQKLAGALMGDKDRWGWIPFLFLWSGFIAGAVIGARCYALWHWNALWLGALAAAALTGLVAAMTRPKPVAAA